MHRLVICLPLCLCMAPSNPDVNSKPAAYVDAVKDDGSALVTSDEMARLAKNDVLTFYKEMLLRYKREVKGYTATFLKQELIGDQLRPTEVIDIQFREHPHSVFMTWQKGAGQASRVLYVEGENNGKLQALPTIAPKLIGVIERDVNGKEARNGNRYTLQEFGLFRTADRTLKDWTAAQEAGELRVEYLGVKKVKEAGDRSCYVLHRALKKPDRDGVSDATMYIDVETWLQVGTVLKDAEGNLLGSYFFRDLKLNPEFKKDQFTKAALTQ